MQSEFKEQRQLPRLLCGEAFEDCCVSLGNVRYCVNPVNFNHQGMSIATASRLPDSAEATITFTYKGLHSLLELPFRFVYVNETDACCHYGIAFDFNKVRAITTKAKLEIIENHLMSNQNPEDRYGLLSSQ